MVVAHVGLPAAAVRGEARKAERRAAAGEGATFSAAVARAVKGAPAAAPAVDAGKAVAVRGAASEADGAAPHRKKPVDRAEERAAAGAVGVMAVAADVKEVGPAVVAPAAGEGRGVSDVAMPAVTVGKAAAVTGQAVTGASKAGPEAAAPSAGAAVREGAKAVARSEAAAGAVAPPVVDSGAAVVAVPAGAGVEPQAVTAPAPGAPAAGMRVAREAAVKGDGASVVKAGHLAAGEALPAVAEMPARRVDATADAARWTASGWRAGEAVKAGVAVAGATPAGAVGAAPAAGGGVAANEAAAVAPAAAAGTSEMGRQAAGLAAAVTAMVREGKNALSVKLDPPALGAMSIHLAVGEDAKVNVLLVAAAPQTAQVFAAGADELRAAFVNAGIDLGQLNVGGGKADSGAGQSREQPLFQRNEVTGDAAPAVAAGVRAIA